MNKRISFKGTVQQFTGVGEWFYIVIPKKYQENLKIRRRTWGTYPIVAHIGNTSWKTKLMMKKGGSYFIALKIAIRKEEHISLGDTISVSFTLN